MTTEQVFFGNWQDEESMWKDWFDRRYREHGPSSKELAARSNVRILFASYGNGDYCGDAFVLFRRGKKLFQVHGSHCSCFGLEDQWDPELANWKEILNWLTGEYKPDWVNDAPQEARDKLRKMCVRELAKAEGSPSS